MEIIFEKYFLVGFDPKASKVHSVGKTALKQIKYTSTDCRRKLIVFGVFVTCEIVKIELDTEFDYSDY